MSDNKTPVPLLLLTYMTEYLEIFLSRDSPFVVSRFYFVLIGAPMFKHPAADLKINHLME